MGRKKNNSRLKFTFEILPPGTLQRNSNSSTLTPTERWEEISSTCVEIIAESQNQVVDN